MPSLPLVLAVIASLLFTVRSLIGKSWEQMWCAALCFLVVSALGVFSIGGAIFLIACLQIAAVVDLSSAMAKGSSLAVLLASVII